MSNIIESNLIGCKTWIPGTMIYAKIYPSVIEIVNIQGKVLHKILLSNSIILDDFNVKLNLSSNKIIAKLHSSHSKTIKIFILDNKIIVNSNNEVIWECYIDSIEKSELIVERITFGSKRKKLIEKIYLNFKIENVLPFFVLINNFNIKSEIKKKFNISEELIKNFWCTAMTDILFPCVDEKKTGCYSFKTKNPKILFNMMTNIGYQIKKSLIKVIGFNSFEILHEKFPFIKNCRTCMCYDNRISIDIIIKSGKLFKIKIRSKQPEQIKLNINYCKTFRINNLNQKKNRHFMKNDQKLINVNKEILIDRIL